MVLAHCYYKNEVDESIIIWGYTSKIKRVGTKLSGLAVLFMALNTIYSIISFNIILYVSTWIILYTQCMSI